MVFFFFKQKTAYEMRISDWSSDVCSSDLDGGFSADDERLVSDLAAHAAVLIEHSRLYEASHELSVLEERNRLARELHDALSSDARRVGQVCVSPCRSWWSPYH